MLEQIASPLLSIVTTSYSLERLKDIENLLHSIKTQTYSNIELIFVIEGSMELFHQVETLIKIAGITNSQVIISAGTSGADAARNLGIENTNGEIVAIIDDDVMLFPDWADQMVKTYSDSSIVGITGPIFPSWEEESMSWFPEEFSWMWGGTLWCDWHKFEEIREIRNVSGANCSFKKEALVKVGGYLTNLGGSSGKDEKSTWYRGGGEEVELSLRVSKITGKKIVFNPKVKVYHKVYHFRLNRSWIMHKAFTMGYCKHMIEVLYPKSRNKPTLKQEHILAGRILTRLLPKIARSFFSHPRIACRQFSVTIIGSFFTVLGYTFYIFKPLKVQIQKRG